MTESDGLPEEASTAWRQLVDETEEMAVQYRDRGWEATVVHPGDITAVHADDQFGLNALAPDSEYDEVRSLVEAHEFDQSHVYRRDDQELRFFLCVFEASEADLAVLVPAYATETDLDMLYPRAHSAGEMRVFVRPLEYDERATLTVADPDLFLESGEYTDGPRGS
jgi:hypothetical protein